MPSASRRNHRTALLAGICAISSLVGWAQGRNVGFEWPATNADLQRTSWLRLDPHISAGSLSNPGFQLQWREKLDNAARGTVSLHQGITMNGLLGFAPASFVTGASNVVFALDNDTGFPLWHRKFDDPLASATASCPGGMTGAVGRVTTLIPPELQLPVTPQSARSGYRGGIGQPGEGIPMELARRDGGAALRGVPPAPAPGGGGGGVFAGRYTGPIYVVTSAGTLHAMGQTSGLDLQRPTPFLPANARYSDLTAVGDMLYTTTSDGCGGAPNAVWAISLNAADRKVASWNTTGGKPVGNLAFTRGGRLIVAVGPGNTKGGYGNAVVALDAKTLQPVDWFSSVTSEFATTPVVIQHRGREIVAAATRDGRIFLLDATALGGADHATPLFASAPIGANFAPDAMATFEVDGTSWLLVPLAGTLPSFLKATNGAVGSGAIIGFRIMEEGGRITLQPAWTSRDITAPTAPIIVNDVVFVAASGRPKGAAVLYALDSRSGRELWNSGKSMTSYIAGAHLWASNSQVYAATFDATVYAFGFTMERR